ncbi:neurocan core protein-like [Neocloeon triangulifer]|uniref:neurocan core protein-like n=1 Tax=Neocloeon triangulifer TaxID=2078957 RepID=UPI00286F5FDB|nr:neurocan core protein-like [Neocloeon triangulifer]
MRVLLLGLLATFFMAHDSHLQSNKKGEQFNISSELKLLSNGKKYMFSYRSNYLGYPTNWVKANETCAELNLHLATFHDETDLKAVWAETQTFLPLFGWWVSAKKDVDFLWHDGTKLKLDSPLWREEKVEKGHDCVYVSSFGKGKLNSNPCETNFFFICEQPDTVCRE